MNIPSFVEKFSVKDMKDFVSLTVYLAEWGRDHKWTAEQMATALVALAQFYVQIGSLEEVIRQQGSAMSKATPETLENAKEKVRELAREMGAGASEKGVN